MEILTYLIVFAMMYPALRMLEKIYRKQRKKGMADDKFAEHRGGGEKDE